MRDYKEQVNELAALMEEFRLSEASMNLAGFQVTFRRQGKHAPQQLGEQAEHSDFIEVVEVAPPTPEARGNPITSPMAGIFYVTSSPSSPPFVKEGEAISAGQTVGLIEAMKVFNEIPSPYSGTVLQIVAENGAVVQPGDVLLRIG